MSSDANTIIKVHSPKEFDQVDKKNSGCLIVIHFTAKWSTHCQQVHEIFKELEGTFSSAGVVFVEVEAEELPSISQRFGIVAVPTCVLLKNGEVLARVDGVNAAELYKKVQQHSSISNKAKDLNSLLKSLINQAPVMVFMKGAPNQPKCGFSKTLVTLLNGQGVKFDSFDILSNEEVRQGLKEFSNWPTYPQVYVNGELVGGLDIVKELIESGEFAEMLPRDEGIEERLKKLINKERVMLFMKGSPSAVQCGFSKSIIEILNSKNITYGHFDILKDEEVRQGLKTFSNWPTYPQLYIKGDLVGGLDIVKELNQSGELEEMLK